MVVTHGVSVSDTPIVRCQRHSPLRIVSAAMALLLAVAACSSGQADQPPAGADATPTESSGSSPTDSPTTSESPGTSAEVVPPANAAPPQVGPEEVVAGRQSAVDGGSSSLVAIWGGWALGSWETADGVRYALREPGKGWSVQESVGNAWMGDIALGKAGTALMTWKAPRNAVSDGLGSWVERHRERGRWSEPGLLVKGTTGGTDVVVDRFGSMTAAWADGRGVHAMTRPPGGTWGKPTHFSSGRYAEEVELTANRHGDLLLAWPQGYRQLRTAFRPASGKWAPEAALSGRFAFYPFDIALNDRGQALVMWGLDSDELCCYVRRYLAWASRDVDGTWSKTQDLDTRSTASVGGVNEIDVSVNNRGQALAVWDMWGRDASRVARLDWESGWSAPESLRPGGATHALLTETGDAMVALAADRPLRQNFWWHQSPDGTWERHGLALAKGSGLSGPGLSLDSAGRAMVAFAHRGDVAARYLRIPPPK